MDEKVKECGILDKSTILMETPYVSYYRRLSV